METLGFAILLATGLLVAKICQRCRLPSVTGYILAGVLLGPSGFNLINSHSVGSNLDHFTNIALVLISFGIGEHVELKKLRKYIGTVAVISLCEASELFLPASILRVLPLRGGSYRTTLPSLFFLQLLVLPQLLPLHCWLFVR